MPMMRGVKFACEPCIRGHRSSKCNHSDRVLVQVRKPGRPLSSCPHTLSSTSTGTFVHSLPNGGDSGGNRAGSSVAVSCSCDVTSVAIPKVASCACGPPKPQEPPPRLPPPSSVATSSVASDSGALITSPISPTFPVIVSSSAVTNGPSNKIVKPQRLKKNGQARKGSVNIGEAALGQLLEQEREHSSGAESSKAENTTSNGDIPSASGSTEGNELQNSTVGLPTGLAHRDINGLRPSQDFAHSQNGNMFFERTKVSVVSDHIEGKPDMPAGIHNSLGAGAWEHDGGSSWQLPQPTPKKAGCGGCGGKLEQPPQSQPQQHIHHAPAPQNPQGASCCNSSSKGVAIQPQQMAIPQVSFSGHPFFPAPQYPASYISPTNFSQVPNVWMYPTINPAITPLEFAWLQQQRAAGVFGPQPAPQLPGHVALVSPINNTPVANTSMSNGWEHNCHCGPACNCLGCATHPFNRRTVEHVREMQSFMAFENHGSLSPQPHASPTNNNHLNGLAQQLSQPQTQSQQNRFETNGISLSSAVSGAPSLGTCCGNKSSPGKQISPAPEEEETGPDGTPNGTDAGDELSPSNFLYFDFPLGTCAQTELGCKCGEGCTCVGCITHGGHIELDTPVEAAEWEGWGTEEGS